MNASTIHRIAFNSDDVPVRVRIDAVNGFFGRHYDVMPTEEAETAFRYRCDGWQLGSVQLWRSRGQHLKMLRERLPDRGVVVFVLNRWSISRGSWGESPIHSSGDDLIVLEETGPFAFQRGPLGEQFLLAIPFDAVGYDPGRHPRFARFEHGSPEVTMAWRLVDWLVGKVDGTDRRWAELAGRALIGLVSDILDPMIGCESRTEMRHMAKRLAIQHEVNRNLTGADLSVEAISKQFGVSRATLFRIFEPEGGLHHYVRDRRLDRAYVDLSRERKSRGAVGRVAERYGFFDTAHFSRAFRDRFNCLAKEIVGIGADADGARRPAPALPQKTTVETFLGI